MEDKKSKIYKIIAVGVILVLPLWYVLSFGCLTDNAVTGAACIQRQGLVSGAIVFAFVAYGIYALIKSPNNGPTTQAQPYNPPSQKKPVYHRSMYYFSLLCLYLPGVMILLSATIFGADMGLPFIFQLITYILYYAILPLFVLGMILRARSLRP